MMAKDGLELQAVPHRAHAACPIIVRVHASNPRSLARRLFLDTLQEISVQALMPQWIRREGDHLRFPRATGSFPASLELTHYRSILTISLGKAAGPMLTGWRALSGGLSQMDLIVSPQPFQSPGTPGDIRLRAWIGGHPEPNAESLRAGEAMLEAVRKVKTPALILYFISGGGSALVEAPRSVLSLAEIQATYRALVLSGASITEINVLRKHLSAFKGGRLAQAASEAGEVDQLTLLISDVPEGDPSSISSGPTCPDESTVEDCYRLYQQHKLQFPPRVAGRFEDRLLEETPKPGDSAFARSHGQVMLDNRQACEVLAHRSRQAGLHPEIDHTADEWEYRRAARFLTGRLRQLKQADPAACLIAGGEVRVRVEGDYGRGGRNQALALEAATLLADTPWCLLSGGTDGIDGHSTAAGAVVDGTTVQRALGAGYDPLHHLRTFDAWPLLHAIDDTIETGPTGQNVRDLRLLL